MQSIRRRPRHSSWSAPRRAWAAVEKRSRRLLASRLVGRKRNTQNVAKDGGPGWFGGGLGIVLASIAYRIPFKWHMCVYILIGQALAEESVCFRNYIFEEILNIHTYDTCLSIFEVV